MRKHRQVAAVSRGTWTNWVGNQTFDFAEAVTPADEEEVREAVKRAAASGMRVRAAGAGHSFTPVVATDGLLLDLQRLRGVVAVDSERKRVTALPATTIADFADPLWQAGLALRNQGDIDTQGIAGAVATSTHGSGIRQPSFSAAVRSARLVTGTGEVVEVDGSDPDLLHAAQVAIGMLGVMVQVELEVTDAYWLHERIEHLPHDAVLERWEDAVETHRHFSFFWMPTARSADLYGLPCPAGVDMTDRCYVKVYDEVTEEEAGASDAAGSRWDRSYRIYPHVFEPNFHEMEYMVPAASGKDAFGAVRRLVQTEFPTCVFPVEVRFTAADAGLMSPNHERDTTVISVSGEAGTDYVPFLRAVHRTLEPFSARPHWGKLHFMTRGRLEQLFPRFDRFVEIRRQLDPDGVFLNHHLAPLFT